jgi:hypothetical protein
VCSQTRLACRRLERERQLGGTSRTLWRPTTWRDMRLPWSSFRSEPQATARAQMLGRGLAVKLYGLPQVARRLPPKSLQHPDRTTVGPCQTGGGAGPWANAPPGYGGRGVSRPCVGVGKLSQDPPLRRGLVLRNPRSVNSADPCSVRAVVPSVPSVPFGTRVPYDGCKPGLAIRQEQDRNKLRHPRGFDEERPFGLRKTQRVVPRPAPGSLHRCGVLVKP